MNRLPMRVRRALALVAVPVALGTALVPVNAAAPSVVTGYNITLSHITQSQYLVGHTNLFPSGADDSVVKLTTAGRTMPFAVMAWGVKHTSMWVSSNGNVQFGKVGLITFTNACLPTSTLSAGGAVAPFWDDLVFGPQGSGDGVYTATYGSAPHRQFVVSWRGTEFGTSNPVRAEVVFLENSSKMLFQYDWGSTYSTTIGTQKTATGPIAEWSCNATTAVANLTRLTLNPI